MKSTIIEKSNFKSKKIGIIGIIIIGLLVGGFLFYDLLTYQDPGIDKTYSSKYMTIEDKEPHIFEYIKIQISYSDNWELIIGKFSYAKGQGIGYLHWMSYGDSELDSPMLPQSWTYHLKLLHNEEKIDELYLEVRDRDLLTIEIIIVFPILITFGCLLLLIPYYAIKRFYDSIPNLV
jgi:hypothetical protein